MSNCTVCKKPNDNGFKSCDSCKLKRKLYMDGYRLRNPNYQRDRHRRRRQMVIDHYGGVCECCGEDTYEFLALDHINGGGTAERVKDKRRGTMVINYIIEEGYPDTYRLLCHNCNMAIGFYGACPHEEE